MLQRRPRRARRARAPRGVRFRASRRSPRWSVTASPPAARNLERARHSLAGERRFRASPDELLDAFVRTTTGRPECRPDGHGHRRRPRRAQRRRPAVPGAAGGAEHVFVVAATAPAPALRHEPRELNGQPGDMGRRDAVRGLPAHRRRRTHSPGLLPRRRHAAQPSRRGGTPAPERLTQQRRDDPVGRAGPGSNRRPRR